MRRLGWLFDNLGWKALALVCAVAVWWLVASEPEYSVFVRVPLAYENLPDELEISAEPVNTVSLELRGPSGQIGSLTDPSAERPAVILDMSGVQEGERTFPIGDTSVRLARGVRLVRRAGWDGRGGERESGRRAGD